MANSEYFFIFERDGEFDWHNDWESSYDKGYSTDLITEHAVKCIQEYSKEWKVTE